MNDVEACDGVMCSCYLKKKKKKKKATHNNNEKKNMVRDHYLHQW